MNGRVNGRSRTVKHDTRNTGQCACRKRSPPEPDVSILPLGTPRGANAERLQSTPLQACERRRLRRRLRDKRQADMSTHALIRRPTETHSYVAVSDVVGRHIARHKGARAPVWSPDPAIGCRRWRFGGGVAFGPASLRVAAIRRHIDAAKVQGRLERSHGGEGWPISVLLLYGWAAKASARVVRQPRWRSASLHDRSNLPVKSPHKGRSNLWGAPIPGVNCPMRRQGQRKQGFRCHG